jgi:hypothetical protein
MLLPSTRHALRLTAARTSRTGIIRPQHLAQRNNSFLVVGGCAVAAGAIGAREVMKIMEARKAAAAANPEPETEGAKAESASWFDSFGKRYYEGPFEAAMTRREAALILGVRESATAQRIKDAHRRILRINHPDMGGSAFLSAKVNEAKELLIKGKEDPMDKKRG